MKGDTEMNFSIGDIVQVNEQLQIQQEEEKKFINEQAEVIKLYPYLYPVEIKFKNTEIQELNESLGTRLFDYFELTKI